MHRKLLINLNKKHVLVSFMVTLALVFSGIFAVPGGYVLADGDSNTTETTKQEDDEEKNNILKPKTGRVEFWDWKAVNGNNVRTIFSDNLYHPVILATGRKNTDNKHYFLSSYADRDHFFLPTMNDHYLSGFTKDFTTLSYNAEKDTRKEEGYCGKDYDYFEHSFAYYFDAEENLFIKMDKAGYDNALSDDDMWSSRFFTTGGSMGVPWIKATKFGSDNGRTAISICFPREKLSGSEAAAYQPDSKDFYLYVAGLIGTTSSYREPAMYCRHEVVKDPEVDNWHMVYNNDCWFIVAYNDSYCSRCASFISGVNGGYGLGHSVYRDDMRYCYLTMATYKNMEIIPQGCQSLYGPLKHPAVYYGYNMFVGTPHLFTSITSQTINAGELLPIDAGAFVGAGDEEGKGKGKVNISDGIILPKGEVLTIDGGTVYVGTNLINNGKIVVKNGGTLVVKDGGCISPYTKFCQGQGTIECDGGNVVVMPGGKIYGFCTGIDKNKTNPYDESNAPLRLVGGGTMINYGTVVLTYGVIGKGSKIEVRKNGVLKVGYNRKDQLEFMAKSPDNLSFANPANYPSYEKTVGLFGVGGHFTGTTASDPIGYQTSGSYRVLKGKIAITNKIEYEKATVVVEKTATFAHNGNNIDYAPSDRVDIIIPEY